MKKILVIEDMESLREDIIQILECLDFEAMPAENGMVGVELAKNHLPDLIICDIMMPELDGYGVFTALRQNVKTATIPFIFLSAKADKSDIRQGMNLGADDYLTKPFTIAELKEAIAARLERKQAMTQPYITEMKRAEENLNQLTYQDTLTNLPNRTLLHQRLQEALVQTDQTQDLVAIFCVNLKRFKVVNTTLGHGTGDLLLQAVAERLTQCLNPRDIVARLGGDEFSVVLLDINQTQEINNFAQKVIDKLSQPYIISNREIRIQISIGITIYPENDTNIDKLLNQADTAMRWAKVTGGSNYQFYSAVMDSINAEREVLETNLSYAIERSEFHVYYQPQIHLISGRIFGAEALIRWQQPELGMVSPAKFIPLAEETGLIVPIGELVLRTACLQAKAWQKSNLSPIRISVNLSACQLKHPNIKQTIAQVLAETNLEPSTLELELTETSVMDNVEETISILQELKAMGISISIDDFGTGYSSLNYLKRFPIDTLKIDRSFIIDITNNANDAAIATAIITMAQSLKLQVIAEGVETNEQLHFLREHGCDAMQGYLFSPAVTAEKFEQLLIKNNSLENHLR